VSGVDESARGELVEPFQRIHLFQKISINLSKDKNKTLFAADKKISTRKAYGYALSALGKADSRVVALDGDVKNSTFSEIFEKDFPTRFIECFIAEQNMVGVATGLQSRGKIAFASTFGAFLTRAFDQIRMAGVGKNALRLCVRTAGFRLVRMGRRRWRLKILQCLIQSLIQ